MYNTSKIKNKSFRNWVRGCLGLFFLKEGLYLFIDRLVKAEHTRIVQNLSPCTNCAIENILPAHSGKDCIQKNKGRCNCRKRTNLYCATCSKIYDDIVKQHRFKEPLWVTDCSTWYTDHWQFAKCFLTTTAQGCNNTAAETDASGLLSIIINGEFFQSETACIIDPPNDYFSQVREIRNKILHSSDQDLTDHEVTTYLQSMISVLEDMKTLSLDPAAQAAVKKINEILNDELVITVSEEADVIQTSDSTTEINTTKKRAIEHVTSAASGVSKKLKTVETEQETLHMEQFELEKEVNTTKSPEKKPKAMIKQEEVLQGYLVDAYKIHYVKTSISPLMKQHNTINISDVYASPHMVVKKKEDGNDGNTSKSGEGSKTNNKHIKSYRDIFGTDEKRNRRIFIEGDIGTGKSSFCKMMMHNWCSSITKQRNTDESGDMDGEDGIDERRDKYDMSQFDFLFYIPLCKMSGYHDIVDMIKAQLEEKYSTLVDDIFANESGRCLVLADGLDEWTQPESIGPLLHNITVEIPTTRSVGNATIITTSRPSSRGILNMKSSDYDLNVTLFGLDKNSVQPMIENYMKLLNNTSTVSDFKATLLNLTFKDIHNAPMLLQQFIWLYCKGHDIGKSRSSFFSNIVNIVLAWELDKLNAAPVLDFKSSSLEHFSLPTSFDELERCQENRKLLLKIGKIAYDAYITGNSLSPGFGRYKMEKLGLSDDAISAILRTGILTEVNCTDPTYMKSRLSFIHTYYVESFAALYICSCYLSEIPDAHSSVTPLTKLKGLIAVTPETSLTGILRLENVLIMMCGLVPCLTEHVCECLYKVPLSDKSMDENLHSLEVGQIKRLILDCLSEQKSVDQETVVKFKLP